MEVILLTDVESLGKEGEVVSVKDGFARNYLFPRSLAASITPNLLKVMEQKKAKKEIELKKMKSEKDELAKKIGAISCTISVEAGVEDKIFGAVTQEMIRNAIRPEGIEVDKKDIILDEPIKKLGVHQVAIKLHPEVTASLKVWVVKK